MSSSYYKSILKTKKNDLKNYKERKTQLNSIKNGYSAVNSHASDLNVYYKRIVTNIGSGISIIGGANNADDLWRITDDGTGDTNLSTSKASINTEIQRVNDMIESLNDDIAWLNKKIAEEERKEREEREKLIQQTLLGGTKI